MCGVSEVLGTLGVSGTSGLVVGVSGVVPGTSGVVGTTGVSGVLGVLGCTGVTGLSGVEGCGFPPGLFCGWALKTTVMLTGAESCLMPAICLTALSLRRQHD